MAIQVFLEIRICKWNILSHETLQILTIMALFKLQMAIKCRKMSMIIPTFHDKRIPAN